METIEFVRVLEDGTKRYRSVPSVVCPDSGTGQHNFNPEDGAMFGVNGVCCVKCGQFNGIIDEVALGDIS